MATKEKEYSIADLFAEDVDKDTKDSVSAGVMSDNFEYGKLTGSILSIIVATVFLILLMVNMYGYFKYETVQQAALQTEYTQISTLRAVENEKLTNVGIIDAENSVYHIPIEDAIKLLSEK